MSEHYFDDQVFFQSDDDGYKHSIIQSQSLNNSSKKQHSLRASQQELNPELCTLICSKNKYATMLKSIQAQNNLTPLIIKQQSSLNQQNKNLDKKQRNKQAAKNSRDRKKMYIEILEERKREKEKLLASKKKELEEAQSYYDKLVSQNRTMSNFAASRHQLIKRLELLLEKSQKNQQLKSQQMNEEQRNKEEEAINKQINEIIHNLRSMVGATGKQRMNTINQYFQQIINLSLPALHRYLMWSASQHKHLFSQNQQEQAQKQQWFKQLKTALNLTEQQRRQIQNKQKFLQEQKSVLQNLIEQLKSVKDDIQKKSFELDDLIDEIRKILTPIQCARFILFIERNKYRKELNLCDNYSEVGSQFGAMRKLVKKG